MHQLHPILQPFILGIHIIDPKLDDRGPIGSLPSLNRATVSALPMAGVADGVTISAKTGASQSAVFPVTIP